MMPSLPDAAMLREAFRHCAAMCLLPWAAAMAVRTLALLAAAALVLWALRRASAASRHLVLALTVLGLLVLPLLSLLLPPLAIHLPTPPPALLRTERSPNGEGARDEAPPLPVSRAPRPEAAPPAAAISLDPRDGAALALLLWLAGAGTLLFRLVAANIALYRHASGCRPVHAGRLRDATDGAARALGVRRPLSLLLGDDRDPPMAWGWRRPVLLLPRSAETWPDDRLNAVLLHEVVHVARVDWSLGHLARIACALHWLNPFVWLVVRRMQQEAEHACDDRVLLAGVTPVDYAGTLVSVAHHLRTGRGVPAAAAVAMATRRPLVSARVRAILEAGRRRRGPSPGSAAFATCAATCIVVLAAILRSASPGEPSLKFTADSAPPRVAMPPPSDDADAVVSATETAALPGGLTVRLLRVTGRLADGSSRGWAPDGSTLPAKEDLRYRRNPGSHLPADHDPAERCVFARITAPLPNDVHVYWISGDDPDVTTGWGSGGSLMSFGMDTVFTRPFAPPRRPATLRLAVAADAWQTILTAPGGWNGAARFGPDAAPVTLKTYYDGAPSDAGPIRLDRVLKVTMSLPPVLATAYGYQYRLSAVGDDGTPYPMAGGDHAPRRPFNRGLNIDYWVYPSFRKTPVLIRAFRFEVRPYRRVIFRDVAVEPDETATADSSANRPDSVEACDADHKSWQRTSLSPGTLRVKLFV